MKKKPQISTIEKGLAKNEDWYQMITSESFMHAPEKDGWRKRLVFALFKWLENPENIMLEDFCFDYRIPRSTLDRWRLQYADIASAVDNVKIFIGARRRKGAMQFKYHYASAFRDMQQYDPSWKEVDQYHASLSAEAINKANETANNKNPITVVINRNNDESPL